MEDVVCEIIEALMTHFEGVSLNVCEIEGAREVGSAEIAFYIIGICVVADAHIFQLRLYDYNILINLGLFMYMSYIAQWFYTIKRKS